MPHEPTMQDIYPLIVLFIGVAAMVTAFVLAIRNQRKEHNELFAKIRKTKRTVPLIDAYAKDVRDLNAFLADELALTWDEFIDKENERDHYELDDPRDYH